MTVKEFVASVEVNAFIDYDGFGYPVKNNKHNGQVILPSRVDEIPKDTTHIVWFNR